MRIRVALSGLVLGAALCGARSVALAGGTSGSLDPSFGSDGKVLSSIGSGATDAVLESNGDVVVGVDSFSGFELARFLPTGRLDPSFGSGGVAQALGGSVGGQPASGGGTAGLALQANGQIVASGTVTNASGTALAVARFNANGTPDPSFGKGGFATANPFGSASAPGVGPVLVEGNGDILVGASMQVVNYRSGSVTGAVVRFTPQGRLDNSFGSGGVVTLANTTVTTLGVDAAGDAFTLPAFDELSPTGALDPSVTASTIVASSQGGPFAFLPNGEVFEAETVGVMKHVTAARVQRFTATGSVDGSFSSPLIQYVAGQNARDSGAQIAIEPNGEIVVGGAHWFGVSVFGLARLNANGTLDTSFGTNGTVTTQLQGNEGITSALLTQPDGKIIGVGYSEDNSTATADVAMTRYLP